MKVSRSFTFFLNKMLLCDIINNNLTVITYLLVASLFADGPVRIDDTDCIAKSFPGFLENFEKLKR